MGKNSREIDSILEGALEIDSPAERDEFLKSQCGDNPALLREVESLLDANAKMNAGFLDQTQTTTGSLGIDYESGTMVGPYKLREEIGVGGMGTVWMADQTEPIKRRVAVKLIKAGMDSKQILARFDAERQALALMDHPNIARVLDAGVTDQGRPFFAMEYVKGTPLNEYCDKSRLSIGDRLNIFLEICSAVQHAHQKGIIHRDLKPSNILVCLYDGKPVPKVIDFGLAKAMTMSLTDQTLYTGHGVILGTPLYMSPEQAEQNNLDIDTRSDVYSLGVILYELLTGSTPLEKEEFGKAAMAEILRVIKEVEPPRPSTRLGGSESLPSVAAQRGIEPALLTLHISGDLDWVIMRALEKDRNRRYPSAENLASDIRRHLSNEPVVAGPPSARYRFQKFVKRNRAGVWVAGLLTTTLILGVIGTTAGMIWAMQEKHRATEAAKSEELQKTKAVAAQEQAVQDAERARIEAKTSAAVARLQSSALAGVGPSVALGRDTTLLEEILERTEKLIAEELGDELEVEATLRSTLGSTYQEMGSHDKASDNILRSLELYRQLRGGAHNDIATELNKLGLHFEYQAKDEEAEKNYRDAISMWEQLGDPSDDDNEAEALRNLATVLTYGDEADVKEARQLLETAKNKLQSFHGSERHPDVATVINAFGNLDRRTNRLEAAEDHYEKALDIQRKTLPVGHPFVSTGILNLAGLLKEMEKVDEAEVLLNEAIEMQRKVLNGHPNLAVSIWTLSSLFLSAGRFDEAEKAANEALAIAQENFSQQHPVVLKYQNTIGQIQSANGQHESALRTYQSILDTDLQYHPDDTESIITTYNNLAFAHSELGRLDEAEQMFRKALAISEQAALESDPQTAMLLQNLAKVLVKGDRFVEARKLFERSLDIHHKLYGAEHSLIANVLSSLGTIHLKLGELDIAASKKQQSIAMYTELMSADHLYTNIVRVSLAEVWFHQGKFKDAENILTAAAKRHEDVFGPNHTRTLRVRNLLGKTLHQLDKHEKARVELEYVIDNNADAIGNNSVGEAQYWLGKTLLTLDEFSKAELLLLQVEKHVSENGDYATYLQIDPISSLVELYQAWHETEPDAGYERKAAQWRAKLNEPNDVDPSE